MAEYYQHEIAKWNVATDDLTLEQEAAYHRVVSQIRLYERPFRENYRVLAGLWRCNERRARRILTELVQAGKLTVEDGFIIDEKAVKDASTLRERRIDKQLAGREGGIQSGIVRRKSLKNIEPDEAPASTREEKAREENNIGGGGDARVRTREAPPEPDPQPPPPDPPPPAPPPEPAPSVRERLLAAMGIGPDGVAGPSKFIGTRADMAEAARWLDLPGMSVEAVCEEIRRLISTKADGPPSSFKYFTPAMRRLSAALSAPPLHPDEPAGSRRGKSHESQRFNQTINAIADGLSAGTIHLDTSGRDPFEV